MCECPRCGYSTDLNQPFPTTMVVNGVKRNVVWQNRAITVGIHTFNPHSNQWYFFNLDSEHSPGQPVSEHSLRGTALAHVVKGNWVFTGGSYYESKIREGASYEAPANRV